MNVKTRTDKQLKYAAEDIRAAIVALPFGAKVHQYYQDLAEVEEEQCRRYYIRLVRRVLRSHLFDPLDLPEYADTPRAAYCHRKHVRNNEYDRDRFRTACFQLAWYRLHGII
jgi:hypothetical protein